MSRMTPDTRPTRRDGSAAARAPVRVGDREREDAAASLSGHATAGRLSADELEERVELAYRARTAGELDVLFADLPVDDRAVEPRLGRASSPFATPGVILLLTIATAASFAIGHPVPPLWLVALVLWRRAARPRAGSP